MSSKKTGTELAKMEGNISAEDNIFISPEVKKSAEQLAQRVKQITQGFNQLIQRNEVTIKNMFAGFSKLAQYIRAYDAARKIADNKAEEILDQVNHMGLSEFCKMEPVDRFTLLSVISKVGEINTKTAKELLEKEKQNIISNSCAEAGRKGANKRHEKMGLVKAYAIEQYEESKFKSVNKTATQITSDVLDFSESIGAGLTASNGKNTIYKWLLEYKKTTTPSR